MYYLLIPIFILFIVSVFCGTNTGSPFQSRQVKEISSHMTKAERIAAIKRGILWGLLIGVVPGLIGLLFGPFVFKSALLGVTVCFSVLPLFAFVLWKKWFPYLYKSQQSFFASSEWSKSQGIEANDIQLFNWQKQK